MRPEFYDLYEDLYMKFSVLRTQYPPVLKPVLNLLADNKMKDLIKATRETIDNAERTQLVKLRPDAKYFLLVNFVEMVLFPISTVKQTEINQPTNNLISKEQMRADLAHDVSLIIQEAAQQRAIEITGHNIIDAIRATWHKIKFNEYLYWASK